ncbi:unnamed protein product [Ostreobium quekettii]|uniref:Glycylpeptide N-tetradecanoyltransferase n=1 Tax=Ostreobium quekettii TaxID=121088 RepID=A0A8S1ITJ2_9CHLO|nr:unnamed protein product [Ostreobium quekettii]
MGEDEGASGSGGGSPDEGRDESRAVEHRGEGSSQAAEIRELFDFLSVRTAAPNQKRQPKRNYTFWGSQPVAQFDDDPGSTPTEDGSIEGEKTVDEVQKEPYKLPAGYEWCTCDFSDDKVVQEVYNLLTTNYVEDDDNMFRFDYSAGFLKWALMPPGSQQEWLAGVRVSHNKKLVGFITAIPATIRVKEQVLRMVEINFLCVHKKLRAKRLAPVLIKEITRRVNLHDIWQAAYTAGVVLPTPVATCRYWHRSLNPKKLIDVGFSKLGHRMTMARTIKLYRLPESPRTPGFRQMHEGDSQEVLNLLSAYLEQFKLAPQLTLEEVKHWLVPRADVIDSFVVEGADGTITDFASFYTLPSSILGHPQHSVLKAAYMYYTVPGATQLQQLMTDVMIEARRKGYDVFNALDVLHNQQFLKDLKFGEGDGFLRYYLFNWRVVEKLQPSDVGLVLL